MAQAVWFFSFAPLSLTLFLSISLFISIIHHFRSIDWLATHIVSTLAISCDDLLLPLISQQMESSKSCSSNTWASSLVWGVFFQRGAAQACTADRWWHSSGKERYITRTLLTWVKSCHCAPEDTVGRMSPTSSTITVAHKVCNDRTALNRLRFSLSLPIAHPSHTALYLYF